MFKLVKNIADANCITHGAKFHADDIFSTVIMSKIIDDLKLIRLLEIPEGQEDKLIFDIGAGEFDHHQKGGNGQRENGIKYAAFGLLWKRFGKEYLKKLGAKPEVIDLAWNRLDVEFVQFIDSIDNGQLNIDTIDIPVVTISDVLNDYNPNWDETKDYDICFVEAVEVAEKIWDKKVKSVLSKLDAKELVEKAIDDSNGLFIILNQYMPYQDFVINSLNPKSKGILYAIYPSNRGGYGIQAIQKSSNSFENRKPFPEKWAGLRDKDLQLVTGVSTARFCHNARFLCTTETLEDAIKIANLAINN